MSNDPYFPFVRQLAEYEVWCNTRALDAAAALESELLFREFPFGLKTIHRTLYHTLGVFGYWTGFIAPEVEDQWRWDYRPDVTIDQMKQLCADLSARYLAMIDASDAQGLLHRDRRIVQVFHLVTHGTHHRTQFVTMLRLLGTDPPFEAGDFAGWQRVHVMGNQMI